MKSPEVELKCRQIWIGVLRTPAFPHLASGFLLAGSVGFLMVLLLVAPELLPTARGIGPVFIALIAAVSWLLARRDRLDAASLLLVFGAWIYVTGISTFAGGLRANTVFLYPLIIIMAGWRLGPGFAITLAGATVAACLGFYLAESMGVLPTPPGNPPALPFVVQALAVIFTAALITSLVRSYRERLDEVVNLSDDSRSAAPRCAPAKWTSTGPRAWHTSAAGPTTSPRTP